MSIDTPKILEISTTGPQFQSIRGSKILLTPLDDIPNGASDPLRFVPYSFHCANAKSREVIAVQAAHLLFL